MMKNKFLLSALALGFLSMPLAGCSIFSSDEVETILPGERISILDLQQDLYASENRADNATITLSPPEFNREWAQKGGNAEHKMGHLALGDAVMLELIWRADIGAGSDGRLPLNTQPIVAGGKVFTLDTRSSVRAFNDQTGKEIWRSSVKHEVEEEPVISGGLAYEDGRLYVTSGYNEVLALNPETGAIIWRSKISAGSRAAPTIKNGRVFVTALNNNVIALNAQDGSSLWEYQGVGETTGLLGAASPAADDVMVVAALSSGDLVALRVENGSVIWTDSLANSLRLGAMAGLSDIRGLPVMNGESVVAISFGGKMAAFEKRNGARLWQRDISGAETPWVADNTVYVKTADYKLIALQALTGDVLWIRDVPKYAKPESRKGLMTWAGPVLAGNRLILTGTGGNIAEFNPKTGEPLPSWSAKGTFLIAPIVASGALYLLSENGSLLAYR